MTAASVPSENVPSENVSPLLELDGAVQADGIDAGVAAHYGGPLTEQRRLLAGEAIVDLSHYGVLSVAGPDRLTWLNSISSQELRHLAAGESSETLLLDPTGRVEYAMQVIDDGVETWLLLESAQLPGLHAWLDKMRFTLRVQIVDHTLAYAVIGSMAADVSALPLSPAAPNGVLLVWHDPWNQVASGGFQYADAPTHPGAAWRWTEVLVPRATLPALRDSVRHGTVGVAGLLALEALRIAAWRPRRATEVDEKTLPHELDWLRTAVHLNKGCYRGQETVAKVHNLGHPPRRLVLLHLDGSDSVLPAHGDEVQAVRKLPDATEEHRGVGIITSSAIHYELGPIALAVVKRTVPATVTLHVQSQGISVAAAQEVIVPQSAGSVAEIPRLPRLGIRTPGR
ncbi:folate-binding protein [Cryobacterium sp. TMT1-21]|uniref:Folate-binding protein n=1 Tax=Cryobacterium shii TaxID=1259235 RepID=A0AAQ2C4B5_9MICO|nr:MULTISPECIES: folate-binding protein YgfZ [Cryobacterium]TFC42800.1 folate-binding protein [Cryobacterium shii]TFC88997.1 folate-binding protein [Cryobacterium sp. TmT2-59]TFD11599.1 folate-binding protein [Cryobacterium sp. TMT4-10]TFD14735.1 folate-binding protein [Cryobacterium sp. TMT1-21]TFD22322.1 folate-binding protein [Cryobacterium sp. TMT2-23]